jgi:hypothetical protein
MKALSEEGKIRRWKMIGHTLRQNRESDGNVAMGTGKENKKDLRQREEGPTRKRGEMVPGAHGMRCKLQQRTKRNGKVL